MLRSSPVGREDAVLAVRLWALASRRYHPTSVLPFDAPDPVGLFAGLQYGGDPVEMLQGLADQIGELLDEWHEWQDRSLVDCEDVVRMTSHLGRCTVSRRSR
jgi:hypothetical protein